MPDYTNTSRLQWYLDAVYDELFRYERETGRHPPVPADLVWPVSHALNCLWGELKLELYRAMAERQGVTPCRPSLSSSSTTPPSA